MTAPPAETSLDDPRFHQTFLLPADPSRGRTSPFTIKYADYGYRNEARPDEERVLLFFSPLMASRMLLVPKDRLAVCHKIRIITTDRPGVGGTDPAAAKDRMGLWREAIPALLSHLSIPLVHCIASHSGGTVYALDFLLHNPAFLSRDPLRPTYVALGAPWILPSHTGSVSLGLVKGLLPAAVVKQTDVLARAVNGVVGPMMGASVGSFVRLVPGEGSAALGGDEGGDREEEAKRDERMWAGIMRRVYDEGVRGISEEALLLLRKGEGMEGGWGDWGDYDGLVPRLSEVLKGEGRMLRVRVFYAEKDALTGDGGAASKGAKWFDGCWEGEGDVIEYQSRTVRGADHDSVWGLRWGAMQEVFESIGCSAQYTSELGVSEG